MKHFLERYYIKNLDPKDSAARAVLGRKAGITGMLCNLLLVILKLTAGIAAGSIAIVADGLNNLSDMASSLMTLLGFRLSQRPADQDHPYGHARYEYLSALAVSVLILVVGVELAKSSVEKILAPEPMQVTLPVLAILVVSILVKLWMMVFYRVMGKQITSPVLFAASDDSRNDVVATGAVLAGCLIQKLFAWNTDGWLGLAVACFILWSGISSLKETVSPLLGKRADDDLVEKLSRLILSHEKILGVHDMLIHDYGPGQCFASVHAEVSAEEDILACHDILEDIEQDALEQYQVHLVIHCDPLVTDDPELQRLQQAVSGAASELNGDFRIHDLHLAEHEGAVRLVFDLAIPYEAGVTEEEVCAAMERQLLADGISYPLVIHIDRVC